MIENERAVMSSPRRDEEGLQVEAYKKPYGKQYFTQYEDLDCEAAKMRRQMYLLERDRILAYCDRGRILDFGCGVGAFLDVFDSAKWEKYGYDISEYARRVAEARGIRVDFNWEREYLDVVVFRGCLQLIDTPYYFMKKTIQSLKTGGWIVFLMTPNYDSIMYRWFKEMPGADECEKVFMLPSERALRQVLPNFGCEIQEFRFPYRETPYANVPKDLWNFVLKCFGSRKRVPFWGNYLECYAKKVRPM